MAPGPTVFVLPGWAGADGLAERLGQERAAAVTILLHDRALAAARTIEPVAVRMAGPQAGRNVQEDLAAAVKQAWPTPGAHGPLIMLWPDLPVWRPAHLAAARADLAAGCDLSLGPVFDGGFYLLALARPLPGLFELPPDTWRRPDAMAMTLALAVKDKIQAGLLRTERALRTSADVAATLADPLLDGELRELLVD
ncbi:MAG: uncharacterized protein QOF83_311 [Solirubrobacteraceae bacterium]|nr:uncharacterized protein [Solirubrobacteraceae bacterium]